MVLSPGVRIEHNQVRDPGKSTTRIETCLPKPAASCQTRVIRCTDSPDNPGRPDEKTCECRQNVGIRQLTEEDIRPVSFDQPNEPRKASEYVPPPPFVKIRDRYTRLLEVFLECSSSVEDSY